MDNQGTKTPPPVSLLPEPSEFSTENKMEEDDDRIACTNNSSLNRIFKIAVDHVASFVESKDIGDNKAQFLAHFNEVFKNIIQENVTINKLPWVLNTEDTLKQQDMQELPETNDAMFSSLSKALEVTTRKRKFTPKACSKLYAIKLKHEVQNLKKAKITHDVKMPSLSSLPSTSAHLELVPPQELKEVCEDIDLLQKQIESQTNQLHQIEKNVAFAKDIARRREEHRRILFDTGYHSD